jgi:hypothetical protein
VVRLGDGVTPLSGAAAPVFIDAYDGVTGTTAGPSIALPTTTVGVNRALTLSGSASAEGGLSRSVDGAWVTLGGYELPLGTAAVATSLGSRTLARVSAGGVVDTRTSVATAAGLDQASVRAAVTVDGTGFWALHASPSMGQLTYTGYAGSPATTLVTSPIIARSLTLFGSQLLASVSVPEGSGVFATNSLPRVPTAAITQLPGFPLTNTLSPYGVVPFDTDRNGAADLLFIADDRAALSGGGVLVWRLVGGRWSMVGSVPGLSNGLRGLTGRVDGANYVLYGTTTEGRTRLLRLAVDAVTWAATITTVATAGVNQVFRGVAFAPR